MFKIVKDNTIIDIIESPCYVVHQARNDLLLSTEEPYGQGIVSSDGSVVWQLEGRVLLGGDYETVRLVEISQEEALELRQILDGTGTDEVEIEDGGVEGLPTEQVYPKVPFTELQAMVQVLVDKVDKLEDENSRLEETIDVLFGGAV